MWPLRLGVTLYLFSLSVLFWRLIFIMLHRCLHTLCLLSATTLSGTFLLSTGSFHALLGQEQSLPKNSQEAETILDKNTPSNPQLSQPLPTSWIRDQSLSIQDGQGNTIGTLEYNIATGSIPVFSDDKKNSANVSYIAYFAKQKNAASQKNEANRPVAFCFNGGPGSSSVWLHIGGLGPKRIEIPDVSWPKTAPDLVDNPLTLLQSADLIFVDPVGTGFSKAKNGSDEKKFFGVDEDISSLGQFLENFLTRFQLWKRPKILIGESYGALRITGIAAELLNRYFINFNGLALISGTVDLRDAASVDTSDFSAIMPVPTYAATARYFECLSEDLMAKPLPDFLTEVEAFCVNQLAPALLVGDALPEEDKLQIAEKLHQYTGLPKETILEQNLRISPEFFAKNLFKHDGVTLGRFDSRYKGYKTPGLEAYWIDPSMYAIAPAFTSAMNVYLNSMFKEEQDTNRYVILNHDSQWNWNRKSDEPGLGYANTIVDTRVTMTSNPTMKLFIAAGIYDLALPYFGQELSMYRLLLPKALRENISIKRYKGGHMMYLNPISLKKLLVDLRQFIDECAQKTDTPSETEDMVNG